MFDQIDRSRQIERGSTLRARLGHRWGLELSLATSILVCSFCLVGCVGETAGITGECKDDSDCAPGFECRVVDREAQCLAGGGDTSGGDDTTDASDGVGTDTSSGADTLGGTDTSGGVDTADTAKTDAADARDASDTRDTRDTMDASGSDATDTSAGTDMPSDRDTKLDATDAGDMGADATVPVDQCLNAEDKAIIDAANPDPGDVASMCSSNCFGGADRQQCIVDCMHDNMSPTLTDGCAHCYAEAVVCATENCLLECLANPDSPDCEQCRQDNGCTQRFYECSGLSP